MRVDAFASEAHFLDHLVPVLLAIPARHRGTLHVWSSNGATVTRLVERATMLGVSRIDVGPGEEDRPVLVASIGDHNTARRHGRTHVALMEHGAGQSYGGRPQSENAPSHPGGRGRDADLFLHPNEHAAGRDRARYPAARIEVVGSPKLDDLPAREEGPAPVIAVSFHWDMTLAPETRCSFRWFRQGLKALARRYPGRVLGHAHPRLAHDIALLGDEGWYARNGIEPVADFRDVLRGADVYVCDNSSTIFEFAATGRPVVLLDSPDVVRSKADHGLRFGAAAGVGLHCSEELRLPDVVAEALLDHDRVRADREAALDVVYAYRTGAAKRAADVLVHWAREVTA